MSLLIYLLKVILVSAIFFGYYRLFLRNKRFHHYNRFFLLSALLLSTVLPFIRIPLLYQPENPVNEAVYRTVSVINSDYGEEELALPEAPAVSESVFTLINSIYLVYAIGVLFLLTLVAKSLLYINSLRKRYPAEKITSLRFYNTHEPGTPFSFFRSVFWNDQLSFNSHEGQQIFRHELFHVQHRHSADRLLSELLTAVFWFNPFFHLIKKELKAIHEFLADQFAISDSDRYAYATLLVQQALDSGKHAVTNHFFQNHIKRRIAMITQFQKSNYGYWSRVMILPVSLLLFFAITLYAKKPDTGISSKIAAAVMDQSLTLQADAVNGGTGKKAGPVTEEITDTIPEKAARERELQKREAELEAIRKKMQEQETMIRKARLEELQQIKKQMQDQEVFSREQEEMQKRRALELMQLRKELIDQQQHVQKERTEHFQRLAKEMKELELNAGDRQDPKLEEARMHLKRMQEEFRTAHERQNNEIREKLRDIQAKSEKQIQTDLQRNRQAVLENMKAKLKDREMELKIMQQKMLDEMREKEREKIRAIQDKNRDAKEINRKNEEINREKQDKDREDRKKKKDDEQSGLKPPATRWVVASEDWSVMTQDSLLTNVIRQYLRSLRYPGQALKHSVEGEIYFSVVVDRKGSFKNFIAYTNKPSADNIKDLVVIGKTPVAVTEEQLSVDETKEIFTEEVKRATDRADNKPIVHPEERTYFFRAIFKFDKLDNENTFQFRNTRSFEKTQVVNISHNSSGSGSNTPDQDTIPGRKPVKRASKSPAKVDQKSEERAEAKAEAKVEAKPALKAKESRRVDAKSHKARTLFERKLREPRKPVLAKKENAKLFGQKKAPLFKPSRKNLNKPGKPVKPADGSGQISEEQQESEENYSTITVTGEK